ncbi:MAG: type II toxin-antitoxin system VapC family toxin [Dehalococcoidia bacterium]|nr:type II toxin-antitoxin system VapC family toxin [Dehalococcoidia bacterium]
MADVPLFILDSFAFLDFFQAEPGGLRVRQLLEQAVRGEASLAVTAVNLGEVAYRTERQYGLERAHEVLAKIEEYPLTIVDVDRELALGAAHLKARHRMAYADCLAAALARHLGATLVTGDPEFRQVEAAVSIEWLPAGGAL